MRLQVRADCCQRLLPLIIHSILLEDSNGLWRETLSSRIRDFFSFCCRSAQAASRSATPLSSDSGKEQRAYLCFLHAHTQESARCWMCFDSDVFFFSRVRSCQSWPVRQELSAHDARRYRLSEAPTETSGSWKVCTAILIEHALGVLGLK